MKNFNIFLYSSFLTICLILIVPFLLLSFILIIIGTLLSIIATILNFPFSLISNLIDFIFNKYKIYLISIFKEKLETTPESKTLEDEDIKKIDKNSIVFTRFMNPDRN
jgi:hypothetical protein